MGRLSAYDTANGAWPGKVYAKADAAFAIGVPWADGVGGELERMATLSSRLLAVARRVGAGAR